MPRQPIEREATSIDALVVGAGVAGVYALYRLKRLGFSARLVETAPGAGGTWYWARYPGCRCDLESIDYSFSFSEELEQEWVWSERYASQPEILRYINHVIDRFDLRRDMQFNTRVTAARFNADDAHWTVDTDGAGQFRCRFLVMASGAISAANIPNIPGLADFKGETFHTGRWPEQDVDFAGKHVAVVGTGSSGIQVIPELAKRAEKLTVFQRTPQYSVPAQNRPLAPQDLGEVKATYRTRRQQARDSKRGFPLHPSTKEFHQRSALEFSVEDQERAMELAWRRGGPPFTAIFADVYTDLAANEVVAEFVRNKIRAIVHNPATVQKLLPTSYPIGAKRICADTEYFDTFNRDNVDLVDLRADPIIRIHEHGIETASGLRNIDAIVFATGYDASTGALLRIDISGEHGEKLADKWSDGPRAHLGLMVAGFPNLFMIHGPLSASVLVNMILGAEQHVEWIADCLAYLRDHDLNRIEPTEQAEEFWGTHVQEVASATLLPLANSWYMGANIEGKRRMIYAYAGGFNTYGHVLAREADTDYKGFTLA